LESVVDSLADVATNGAGDGLVVGKTSGEFLDCGVDDLQALLEGRVVLELQLTKTGLKIGQGGRVQVVCRNAGVAIVC
jgi:hypothetical protein